MKFILALILAVALSACVYPGTQLNEGQLSPVDVAVVQLAVGVALDANPDALLPAYLVTGALLAQKDNPVGEMVTLDLFTPLINKEIDKLNLKPPTLLACKNLMAIIQADIEGRLPKLDVDQHLVLVWQVVSLVHQAAEVRLE